MLREPSWPGRWGCFHPHPPQTRTCRITASGSSRWSFARDGLRTTVDDLLAELGCNATSHRPCASAAIHRRFVDRVAGYSVPSPVARRWFSRRDASLPSIGSRQAQFPDVLSTTKTLRLPAPHTRSLIGFAPRLPRLPPPSCLAAALPHSRRRRAGQDPCSAGGPSCRLLVAWTMRDLPGSLTIHPVPLPTSTTPVGPTPPRHTGDADAAPASNTTKAPAITAISGLTAGLQHTLSTLQEPCRQNPCKTRFRLAGSASTVRESNPLDRFERFQVTHMAFLPSRAYPGASSTGSP
jgi:hypothetical protein